MDEQSGETEEEEVIGEGIGESVMEELVPEWGWQRDKGSWFQRWGEAYQKKVKFEGQDQRSVFKDTGGNVAKVLNASSSEWEERILP